MKPRTVCRVQIVIDRLTQSLRRWTVSFQFKIKHKSVNRRTILFFLIKRNFLVYLLSQMSFVVSVPLRLYQSLVNYIHVCLFTLDKSSLFFQVHNPNRVVLQFCQQYSYEFLHFLFGQTSSVFVCFCLIVTEYPVIVFSFVNI